MAVADLSPRDDRQLIEQAKDGDRDAFRILMQRHMKQAYNVAHRFVGDHDAAEDVTQEAFVKVHAALAGFRGDAEFGTWLHRIVVNIALTRKRLEKNKTGRHVSFDDAKEVATDDHQDALVTNEQQAHVEQALHELPTLQRAVVILRHLNGLSTKQVGSILQCSEGTVKTHLFRGLKKMKTRLAYLQT
jgi:RNA polymerase sigma-70 factor (ECF subfamily)